MTKAPKSDTAHGTHVMHITCLVKSI